MRKLFNWRMMVLYALFAGCLAGFLMMCDETDNSVTEFILIRLAALALLLGCGYPLARLTKKWEKEGKIEKSQLK